MNKVCLIGRITKEPEIKYTQAGVAVVSFTLAVDRDFKDANGNKVTDFINCVAWRNQAEFIANYIKKGYLIGLSGALQTRTYNVSQTEQRLVTEVIVDNVENLTPKDKSTNDQKEENTSFNDDDLPF